ncbi:MAG: histidine kinase, partial [Lachnospiraceae bacterium]|nr:histidine kinase [Lachnospiraceae bacterium]
DSLEASVYNMGYQLDNLMSNSSFSLTLRTILDDTSMRPNELSAFRMIKYFFNSYESSYSYIHSVYISLDGRERFLTSDTGQIANISTYYDKDWHELYQKMDSQKRVFTTRRWIQKHTYSEPVEVISLFYKMTYMDGVIVINIDKSEYGKLLRNVLISDNQKVMLFNTDGDIVCITDPELEKVEWETLAGTIRSQIRAGNEDIGDKWTSVAGRHYYMDMLYSEYLNLYEISLTSSEQLMEEIRFYLTVALLILVAELAVIFIMAYYNTKRTFAYIEECVDIFSAAERGEALDSHVRGTDDEYALILNNIIRLYLTNNRIQMDLREKQHESELAEMIALQFQINPHFIFNTLQTLDFEAIKKLGTDSELHNMIQGLSYVVKYVLSEPMEKVTLRMELEYLKAYLEIQNARFDNSIIPYFEVDESTLDQKVFRMLLQPVLENCFEHGVDETKSRIIVKIKIFDRGDHISFTVVDNGTGMTKEEIAQLYEKINSKSSKNIGLTNINRRLILHYGSDYGIRIRSKPGYITEIRFVIPKDVQRS